MNKNQINIDTFLWRKTSGKSSVWSGEPASAAESGAGLTCGSGAFGKDCVLLRAVMGSDSFKIKAKTQ